MMNLGPALMLSRRSHKRLGEDQIRSGLCDLIGRPAAISKAWALHFLPSLLHRSSQRDTGGISGKALAEAIGHNSSNVTESERGTRPIGHQETQDQDSTMEKEVSDVPVEKATDQVEHFRNLPAVHYVNQKTSSDETPINFCPKSIAESMNPSIVLKIEENQMWADIEGTGCYKSLPAYTVNVGSQRKQSKSNTSPGITGAKASSRVEKRGGRRKDTNDQKNEGISSARKRNRPPHFPEYDSDSNQRFACPFFMQDRAKHLNCLHFQLKRVKDVKQHIFRKHPFHCSNCYKIFPDGQEHEDHVKVITCQPNTWPRDEAINTSISEPQKKQLAVRASSGLSERDQWFSVWKIIFPHSKPPPSPYLKSEVEEGILMVRELLARHGSLALSSLNSTVSLEEMSSNTMPEPRNRAAAFTGDNPAGTTIGTLDMVLASLSEVTVGNSEGAPSSSQFSGADAASPEHWDLASTRVESHIKQDDSVEAIDQNAPWCELSSDSVIQTGMVEPDYLGTVETMYQSSIQLGDINIQEQLTEAVGTQWDGYVGVDTMFSAVDQEQGIASWEEYLIGPHDMSFADNQAPERSLF